jgi:radical SAM modification target selenobiotic family peptide
MKKGKIKKVLAGVGIAGLIASVGFTMGACKKAGSCGKGSCGEKAMEKEEGGASCGKKGEGSCGKKGEGEQKTE